MSQQATLERKAPTSRSGPTITAHYAHKSMTVSGDFIGLPYNNLIDSLAAQGAVTAGDVAAVVADGKQVQPEDRIAEGTKEIEFVAKAHIPG